MVSLQKLTQRLSLTKWLSTHLRAKWFWVRIQLVSHKLKISRLFWARSFLTFRQLKSEDLLWNVRSGQSYNPNNLSFVCYFFWIQGTAMKMRFVCVFTNFIDNSEEHFAYFALLVASAPFFQNIRLICGSVFRILSKI